MIAMYRIGLLAALPLERDALLRRLRQAQRTKLGAFDARRFELPGLDCLLVSSGMGDRRASQAAACLTEQCAPQALISYGIAGALDADLQIGDVIAAQSVCRLERGVLTDFQPLAIMNQASWESAGQALSPLGARLLPGTALTTPGAQTLADRPAGLLHPVLEMETAGIAQVAAAAGVPLYSLRAVSDGPNQPLPFSPGDVLDENANLDTGALLRAILRRPRVLAQIPQSLRNSRQAADRAAIALLAALHHWPGQLPAPAN